MKIIIIINLNLFNIVNFTAYQVLFFARSPSPIRRYALSDCKRYNVSLSDFMNINSNFIKRWYRSILYDELINRVTVLSELQIIRCGFFWCYNAFICRPKLILIIFADAISAEII